MENVEKVKELKPGFVRSSAVFGKNMVLLFHVDKNVILDNHNHPHTQFGYCFTGEFDFNVNGKGKRVTEGESYLIDANIPHSAVAVTEYYSMDIKVITTSGSPMEISYDVMETVTDTETIHIQKCMIGEKVIYKITVKQKRVKIPFLGRGDEKFCLMADKTMDIEFSGEIPVTVEPMKIYCIDGKEIHNMQVKQKDRVFFIVEV